MDCDYQGIEKSLIFLKQVILNFRRTVSLQLPLDQLRQFLVFLNLISEIHPTRNLSHGDQTGVVNPVPKHPAQRWKNDLVHLEEGLLPLAHLTRQIAIIAGRNDRAGEFCLQLQ